MATIVWVLVALLNATAGLEHLDVYSANRNQRAEGILYESFDSGPIGVQHGPPRVKVEGPSSHITYQRVHGGIGTDGVPIRSLSPEDQPTPDARGDERMEDLLLHSEDLRKIRGEIRRFWMGDPAPPTTEQPAHGGTD